MLFVRSVFFNLYFYLSSAVICILCTPLFLLDKKYFLSVTRFWVSMADFGLRKFCGLTWEVRGIENLPDGPFIVASKHQSMWDTMFLNLILKDPAIVLKKELLWIPYYGWISYKTGHIAIDRSAAASALKKMVRSAKDRISDGRPVVIFPEGTRAAPGTTGEYKPGIAALYKQLGVPCVPMAVNSGVYWPRRKMGRKPGTIVAEFLPPLEPGLNRKDFMSRLEDQIESASNRLLEEAREKGDYQ